MADSRVQVTSEVRRLLARLAESPVENRHALSVLDPVCNWWSPGGEPHEITVFGDSALLHLTDEHVWRLLGVPNADQAAGMAECLALEPVEELWVVGESPLRALRPRLTDGRWQISRQYCLAEDHFTPRPSPCVRRLLPDDRKHMEAAVDRYEVARHCSTMMDFNYMCQGEPVVCFGAFADDRLVGFCSVHPIHREITEISWIFTAQPYRRRALGAGLLSAGVQVGLARGDQVAYFCGGALDNVDAMVRSLGFREIAPVYRFVPASAEQWRCWGRDLPRPSPG